MFSPGRTGIREHINCFPVIISNIVYCSILFYKAINWRAKITFSGNWCARWSENISQLTQFHLYACNRLSVYDRHFFIRFLKSTGVMIWTAIIAIFLYWFLALQKREILLPVGKLPSKGDWGEFLPVTSFHWQSSKWASQLLTIVHRRLHWFMPLGDVVIWPLFYLNCINENCPKKKNWRIVVVVVKWRHRENHLYEI